MRALDAGRSGVRELEAAGLGRVRQFYPGDPVPSNGTPGQHVALITGGLVKVTMLDAGSRAPDGKAETLLSIRGRWDLVGEETVILDQASTAAGSGHSASHLMVAALTHGSARVFPAEQLRRFLHEHPAVLWPIAAALCERLADAEARIASTASDNADRRLARLLCDLERHGYPDTDTVGWRSGTRIPLELSHAELASWIGSCRDTVGRILARWRRRGIISTGYRTIVVHDLGTLARIAGVQVRRRTWNWTGPVAV
jgi:CRP/FNR family transcriptional regulator, cyclic AMP receptor protein